MLTRNKLEVRSSKLKATCGSTGIFSFSEWSVARGSLPRVVSLMRPDGALLEQQGSFGLDIGCLEKLFSSFEFASSFVLRISNVAPACPGWGSVPSISP
jgi:hypothetical protein